MTGVYPQDLDSLNMDIQENDLKPEPPAKKITLVTRSPRKKKEVIKANSAISVIEI